MSRLPDAAPETDEGFAVVSPPDAPQLVDDFGTTAAEMHDGEALDGRIAREEPDVLELIAQEPDEGADQVVGRLVDPSEGVRADSEGDMVAADVGTDLGGYSAEESAMHVEPEV